MWPFSMLRERRDRRRYGAAMFIHLGASLFAAMNEADRARVESMVTDLLKRNQGAKPEHARYAPPSQRAFFRALAMQQLDVPIPIDGVTWDGLIPRRRVVGWMMLRYFDDRPLSAPAIEARAFLRAHGLDVPDVLHDAWNEAHPPPRVL